MMSETPRDKFVRLANVRVNKAIKDITLIGNLSNKSNYSYNDDDVEKIFAALNSALKKSKDKFKNSGVSPDDQFRICLLYTSDAADD